MSDAELLAALGRAPATPQAAPAGPAAMSDDELLAALGQQSRNPARPAASPQRQASALQPMQGAAPAAPQALGREERISALLDQGYSPDEAERMAGEQMAYEGFAAQATAPPPPPTGQRGTQDNPIDLTRRLMADEVPLLVQGAYVRGQNGEVYALPGDAFVENPRATDERQGEGTAFIRRPNMTDRVGAFTQAAGEQIPGLDEAAAAAAGAMTGRGFDAMREQQQLSRMLQNQTDRGSRVAGGLAGFVGTSLAPGGAFINGARAGRVGRAAAVGAGYGSLFGAGNTDGDLTTRLQAAAVQGGLGAAGGAAFQRGADAFGAAAAGARANPSAQRQLSAAGVDLTPGQMAGGALRRIEDGMTSVPILGDAIRDARVRGLESFNAAAINEAVRPVGAVGNIGRQGQAEAQRVVSGAYDNALQGVNVPRDPQLNADLTAVARQNPLPRELQSGFDGLIGNYIARFGQGMDGQSWKQLDSEIGAAIRSAQNGSATNPAQRLLADKLIQTREAFQGALERADPMARQAVGQADLANAGLATIRDAGQGLGTAARDGVFTPGDLNRAVRNSDSSAGNRRYAQGDALLQRLSDNAASVLPSTVPDSGTPFRSLLNMGPIPAAGAIGSGVLNPLIPAAAGAGLFAASGIYSRGVQGIINRAYRASTPGAARQALADLQAEAARSPVLQPVYEALQRQLRPLLLGEQTARSTTP
jgi:hypothetical protein